MMTFNGDGTCRGVILHALTTKRDFVTIVLHERGALTSLFPCIRGSKEMYREKNNSENQKVNLELFQASRLLCLQLRNLLFLFIH
jgi:hypothetical protein